MEPLSPSDLAAYPNNSALWELSKGTVKKDTEPGKEHLESDSPGHKKCLQKWHLSSGEPPLKSQGPVDATL
jgi:hypothetical protein